MMLVDHPLKRQSTASIFAYSGLDRVFSSIGHRPDPAFGNLSVTNLLGKPLGEFDVKFFTL